MVHLDSLANAEIFKGLDDDLLADVLECSSEAEFQRGERLFSEGESSESLWVLMRGKVNLEGAIEGPSAWHPDPISLSENMVFGWPSLVPPYQYSLTATCTTRTCKVIKIDRERLLRLFEEDPEAGYLIMTGLLSVIGKRFQKLQDDIAEQRGHDLMNRW